MTCFMESFPRMTNAPRGMRWGWPLYSWMQPLKRCWPYPLLSKFQTRSRERKASFSPVQRQARFGVRLDHAAHGRTAGPEPEPDARQWM